MRFLLSLPALAVVAACASTSPPPGTPRSGGVASAAVLARAGAADAVTFEQAERLFGPPDVRRQEGAGGLLSYRLPGCALALGFAADRAGALRLSVVEISPPTPRDPQPSAAQCAAAAEARKRQGPRA